MPKAFLLAAFLAAIAAAAEAQTAPRPEPPSDEQQRRVYEEGLAAGVRAAQAASDQVAVSAFVYDGNNWLKTMSIANRTGDFTLYVYTRQSLCENLAIEAALPANAGYGWRVSIRTVGFSGSFSQASQKSQLTSLNLQVDWQRLWEGGKPVSGPSESRRFVLRPGDRVPLDTISAPSSGLAPRDAQIQDAERQYTRTRELFQAGLASQQQVDQAAAALKAALATGQPSPNSVRCLDAQMTLYVGPYDEGGRGFSLPGRQAGAGAGSFGRAGGGGSSSGGRAVAPGGGTGTGGGRAGGSGFSGAGGGARASGAGAGAQNAGGSSTAQDGAGFGFSARSPAPGGRNRCDPDEPLPPTALRLMGANGNCSVVTINAQDLAGVELKTTNLELWLVVTRPTGTEEIQYQKVQTAAPAGRFSFTPVVIETPAGNVTAEILGLVQARRTTDGNERLGFAFISSVATPGGGGATGSGARSIAMPKPGDVVSFEIPAGPRTPAGHSFALRVRATP